MRAFISDYVILLIANKTDFMKVCNITMFIIYLLFTFSFNVVFYIFKKFRIGHFGRINISFNKILNSIPLPHSFQCNKIRTNITGGLYGWQNMFFSSVVFVNLFCFHKCTI